MFEKIKQYILAVSSLREANKKIKALEIREEFLINILNDADLGKTTKAEAKEQIAAATAEVKLKKAAARREQKEELEAELEFMSAIPVSGKSAMLERSRAMNAHRERIFELQTEEFAENSAF